MYFNADDVVLQFIKDMSFDEINNQDKDDDQVEFCNEWFK